MVRDCFSMNGDSFKLKRNEKVMISKEIQEFYEVQVGGLSGLFLKQNFQLLSE